MHFLENMKAKMITSWFQIVHNAFKCIQIIVRRDIKAYTSKIGLFTASSAAESFVFTATLLCYQFLPIRYNADQQIFLCFYLLINLERKIYLV